MRAAALKGKNPNDIVAELEKIDDMEFNVLMPPPLNGKVRQFTIHVQKRLKTLDKSHLFLGSGPVREAAQVARDVAPRDQDVRAREPRAVRGPEEALAQLPEQEEGGRLAVRGGEERAECHRRLHPPPERRHVGHR